MKNQSNLSNRGLCCLFVQVYLQPFSGNSTNLNLLIAALKASISRIFPPGLFLSSGFLIKLKSPTIIQYSSSSMSMLWNQSRKANFPSDVHGAYMFVSIHSSPDSLHVSLTECAKLF